jgi:hypothetical protein
MLAVLRILVSANAILVLLVIVIRSRLDLDDLLLPPSARLLFPL